MNDGLYLSFVVTIHALSSNDPKKKGYLAVTETEGSIGDIADHATLYALSCE